MDHDTRGQSCRTTATISTAQSGTEQPECSAGQPSTWCRAAPGTCVILQHAHCKLNFLCNPRSFIPFNSKGRCMPRLPARWTSSAGCKLMRCNALRCIGCTRIEVFVMQFRAVLMLAHTHACAHACLCTRMLVHTHACTHSCLYTLMLVHTHACTHSCLHILMLVRTHGHSIGRRCQATV